MLHFMEMTIDNFGPYKDENKINFTDSKGVSIFWGENGRGKTILLNAFRFALFGSVMRRMGPLESLMEMENYESRDEGKYGFKVAIRMSNDDNTYELTRSYQLKEGVSVPQSDADYKETHFLKMNGSILSPEDREHELNILMPEQVSRFFLFDGELLQEYEELVMENVNSSEGIKHAIEEILGVPVLQNAVSDLDKLKREQEKRIAVLAQKDEKAQKLAPTLDAVNESISEHTRQINNMHQEINDKNAQRRSLEEEMKKTEQIRAWIIQKSEKENMMAQQNNEEKALLVNICEITKECWRGMLAESMNKIINEYSSIISEYESKKNRRNVADIFIQELKTACEKKQCPVCTQNIDDDHLAHLSELIDSYEFQFDGLTPAEEEDLRSLRAQVAILTRLDVSDKKEVLKVYELQLASLRKSIYKLEQDIKTISNLISNYDNEHGDLSKVKQLKEEYDRLKCEISNLNIALDEEKNKLDKATLSKKKLQEQIKKNTVQGELSVALRKEQIYNDIYAIFNQGIDTYRRRLKENVERDATTFFRRIANDKDYVGLQINDNYGLNIILKNGSVVPGRSAGYEHVVALSLIGALHKNAPLQGPIIMDSPFGRLDPKHMNNVVKVLPEMADQVILLVFPGEIDVQFARESLGNALISERHLTRATSMHTIIE